MLEKTKIAQKNKKNAFDFGLVEQILDEAKTLAEQFKTLDDGLWLADQLSRMSGLRVPWV